MTKCTDFRISDHNKIIRSHIGRIDLGPFLTSIFGTARSEEPLIGRFDFTMANQYYEEKDLDVCTDPGYIVESIGIINTVKSSQLHPMPQRAATPQDSFLIIDSSFSVKSTIEDGRSFRLMSFRRAKNGDDLYLSATGRGNQLTLSRKDQTQKCAQIWTYNN